jgi:SAM-dependent methyltransferase
VPRIDNTEFYAAALKKHGQTPQGVHWNSARSQRRRFEILARFLPRNLSRYTLVDAGCGFGDFYTFLEHRGNLPKAYTGLDVMSEMIPVARARTGSAILECDVLSDPLPEADYYTCSGAMNILTRFETHLFIRRCYEASAKGFIFNLLSGEDESLVYNYHLPKAIKSLGKELGASVKITEGYLPRDFTAAFYKDKGWF